MYAPGSSHANKIVLFFLSELNLATIIFDVSIKHFDGAISFIIIFFKMHMVD